MSWLEIAERQAGLVTRAQLASGGVTPYRLRRLLEAGALESVGRGIYALPGGQPGWERDCWIALLRCGDGAFLYRFSAGAAWGFDSINRDLVEVAVPASRHPRLVDAARVRVHPDDLRLHAGFPVTSPTRTLLDLSPTLDVDRLERALECALRNKLVDLGQLTRRLASTPRAPVGRLREVLAARPVGCTPTESDAETLFAILVRHLGLPAPSRQVLVILHGKKYRIDFAWPAFRLAVEVDGAAVHGPSAFDRDIARQNQIVLDGWLILRFGWHALIRDQRSVERDLLTAWDLRTASVRAWRKTN